MYCWSDLPDTVLVMIDIISIGKKSVLILSHSIQSGGIVLEKLQDAGHGTVIIALHLPGLEAHIPRL